MPDPAGDGVPPRRLSATARLVGTSGAWLMLAAFAVMGASAVAPWIAPYDPRLPTGAPFEPPSGAHWLGTNDIGQDLWSELLWGGRVSLAIGLGAAVLGTGIGALAGALAAWRRGPVETVVTHAADIALVVPFLPLMIVLAAFLGPSAGTLVGVIAALAWARPARVVRAAVLRERSSEALIAARALGAGEWRILGRHVLPATLPIVVAEFVHLAGRAILLEASLAFLGLGDPVRKSWGATLFYAQARGAFLSGAWLWWAVPPGALTTLTVLALATIGLRLEPLANPGGALSAPTSGRAARPRAAGTR
jgi:ABC-type dipeptide/oligopeptide/nickel transport system permease subunit